MNDPKHSDDFESEARERLSSLETRQKTLEGQAEDLKDGQSEILDAIGDLDEEFAEEERMDSLIDETKKNTVARRRAEAISKFLLGTAALTGALVGVLSL